MPKISDCNVTVNGRSLRLTRDAVSDFPNTAVLAADPAGDAVVRVDAPVFSADALSAAAYAAAVQDGLQGRSILLTQISCSPGVIPAVVEPSEQKVTLVLPVPEITRLENGDLIAAFPGIRCAVTRSEQAAIVQEGAWLIVQRDEHGEMLRIRYRDAAGTETELVSSGLAAVAAAIDLAQTISDGVIEYGIGMLGGTAEVGVSKKQGAVAGVSICSVLRMD